MNRYLRVVLHVFLFGLLVMACKHDPFPAPPPGMGNDTITNPIDTNQPVDTLTGKPCDPDTVYFNRDILPILSTNCAYSGCHDAATAQDGVILTSYNLVVSTAEIKAFDLDAGDFYELISGQDYDPDDPYSIMPPIGNTPLSAAEVALMRKWILQGAQNLDCDDCDTANVTFASGIEAIFKASCQPSCHSGPTPTGGTSLVTYTEIRQAVEFGEVLPRINHEPGFPPMPQSGIPLPQCQLDKINAWVNAGYPQ